MDSRSDNHQIRKSIDNRLIGPSPSTDIHISTVSDIGVCERVQKMAGFEERYDSIFRSIEMSGCVKTDRHSCV